MSTDKAITCRVVVQIFVCAGRQQQWLVRPVTFFSSPIDTFPLAEKEPDGGPSFWEHIFLLGRLPQSRNKISSFSILP